MNECSCGAKDEWIIDNPCFDCDCGRPGQLRGEYEEFYDDEKAAAFEEENRETVEEARQDFRAFVNQWVESHFID